MYILTWEDVENGSELSCGTVYGNLNSLFLVYFKLKQDVKHKYRFTLVGSRGIIEPSTEIYKNIPWYKG